MSFSGVCKAMSISALWSSGHGQATPGQFLFPCWSVHISLDAMGGNGHGAELYLGCRPDPGTTPWC